MEVYGYEIYTWTPGVLCRRLKTEVSASVRITLHLLANISMTVSGCMSHWNTAIFPPRHQRRRRVVPDWAKKAATENLAVPKLDGLACGVPMRTEATCFQPNCIVGEGTPLPPLLHLHS